MGEVLLQTIKIFNRLKNVNIFYITMIDTLTQISFTLLKYGYELIQIP